jgi:diguanylate cyclase (GGDEF)-like protein/PAS domain S-box-containing protein
MKEAIKLGRKVIKCQFRKIGRYRGSNCQKEGADVKPDNSIQEDAGVNEKEHRQISKEMYDCLTENLMDAIWRLDDHFHFVYVSPAVHNMYGYKAEEIIGRSLFSILTPDSIDKVRHGYAKRKPLQERGQKWESSTFTVETIHKDGHHFWVEVTVNPIFDEDNRLTGYTGVTRDISERRRQEEMIYKYAFRDQLTNLPNRRLFEEILSRAIADSEQLGNTFAIMFLDVDGLKKINDTYGHIAGDLMLRVVADRLRHGVRKEDFVARLAGDEFIAILPGITERGAAGHIVTRLLKSCQQPIVIGISKVIIRVSIGLSFFPTDAKDVTNLIEFADKAMYQAKKSGGGRFVCYS